MSQPNTVPRNAYLGNAVTLAFVYTFRVLSQSHLQVKLDGVLQSSGYTVSGVNTVGGGTVTFTAAPATGVVVEMSRSTPIDQLSTYLAFEQNDLSASQAMEQSLDKITMILQELNALQVPFIEVVSVANGAASVAITHNLNTLTPIVLSANASWNTSITPETPTDPDIQTLTFSSQAPGTGSPTITVMIAPNENFITAQFTGVNDPGIVALTNRTGVALVPGDVVVSDPSNDSSVILADALATKKQLMISVDSTADLATGRFITHGIGVVRVDGTTTRGHYLTKSATTKAAADSGTIIGDSTNVPQGAFAVALGSIVGAGFIVADFMGLTYSAPSTVVTSIVTTAFTANGTYTKAAGLIYAEVECVGGGGGSGGVKLGAQFSAATAGAGGGAYAKSRFIASALGATEAVVRGVGGTAGANTGGNGGNGGDTIFGSSLMVASGGLASSGTTTFNSVTEGGIGGSASTSVGDIVVGGDDGGSPTLVTSPATVVRGGDGGGSEMGGRRVGPRASVGVANGIVGRGYGGGATGAATSAVTTGATGGAGANGVLIITEYIS